MYDVRVAQCMLHIHSYVFVYPFSLLYDCRILRTSCVMHVGVRRCFGCVVASKVHHRLPFHIQFINSYRLANIRSIPERNSICQFNSSTEQTYLTNLYDNRIYWKNNSLYSERKSLQFELQFNRFSCKNFSLLSHFSSLFTSLTVCACESRFSLEY